VEVYLRAPYTPSWSGLRANYMGGGGGVQCSACLEIFTTATLFLSAYATPISYTPGELVIYLCSELFHQNEPFTRVIFQTVASGGR
jgi:hypothetical protein